MSNDTRFDPSQAVPNAFKNGVQAGFEMTKDVITQKIFATCMRRWWHRWFFCACKDLLIQVNSMQLEMSVHEDGIKLSDDEPIIVDEG